MLSLMCLASCMKARIEVVHRGLPTELEGIDRDAVPAQRRPEVEGHAARYEERGGVFRRAQ